MGQINKLAINVRTTEANSVTSGIIAEYSQTTLSSDAHLATIFEQLQPINAKLTESINRIKAG